jgi:hypothetical protein
VYRGLAIVPSMQAPDADWACAARYIMWYQENVSEAAVGMVAAKSTELVGQDLLGPAKSSAVCSAAGIRARLPPPLGENGISGYSMSAFLG